MNYYNRIHNLLVEASMLARAATAMGVGAGKLAKGASAVVNRAKRGVGHFRRGFASARGARTPDTNQAALAAQSAQRKAARRDANPNYDTLGDDTTSYGSNTLESLGLGYLRPHKNGKALYLSEQDYLKKSLRKGK